MERYKKGLIVALLTAVAVGVAIADIRNTPHRMVRESIAPDASDVCVFCHTPDISTTLPLSVKRLTTPPAWQRSVDVTKEFIMYDDIGRLGLGKLSVGSQSIACLSCHDGTQALSVTNSPYDHPFKVPYRGALKDKPGAVASTSSVPLGANQRFIANKRLVDAEEFRGVSQGIIENRAIYWVSQNADSTRRTRSDLPVYARLNNESSQIIPYIECSSCHDPHSENALFLRTSNVGSQLCLTCHIK